MIGKYVAAIYYNIKGRGKLFIAKVNRRFLVGANGPVHNIELDCLKPAVGKTTILQEIPEHLPRDIGLFHIHVISGPLKIIRLKNGKWNVPEYPKLKKTFELMEKLDRKREYKRLYSKEV